MISRRDAIILAISIVFFCVVFFVIGVLTGMENARDDNPTNYYKVRTCSQEAPAGQVIETCEEQWWHD